MAKIEPFEKYVEDYDEWFNKNYDWYDAELNAIRCFIPEAKLKGMEVGVGTGRFAQPLGINLAIEPSMQMLKKAKQRGIQGCLAVAEALPFSDKVFDFVLMVTTICFIDNVKQSFQEVYRVLKPEGFFLVGFVDKESKLGQHYLKKKKQSRFYQEATFFFCIRSTKSRTTSSKSPLPRPHLNQPDPRPWRSEVSRLEAGYSVDWAAKSRRMAVCHGHWPYRGLADHRRPR